MDASPAVADAHLAGAQARFVLFLASLLHRERVIAGPEFGALLATFAATVSETDPGEGAILAGWAAAVRDIPFP